MPFMSRRHILGGAAVGSVIAATNAPDAFAGQQPQWGPAPGPLASAELPSFRYRLGQQPAKAYDGGWAKEATVAEFPVSQTIAGVLMSLSAGALRELHWHANAAEWAYMLDGRARVTTIDPKGHSEPVGFNVGAVWYFPHRHGHSIQGLGPDVGRLVLVFDHACL